MIEDASWLTGAEAGFLSEEERLRLAGFRFPKRRADWLLGRWTAKQLLLASGLAGGDRDLDRWQVDAEPGGQPYFTHPTQARLAACLTISHREGKALCALAEGSASRIGADIELIEPRGTIFREDYLSVSERAALEGADEGQVDRLVTLAWSMKESVFKALGKGLRLDPRNVDVINAEVAQALDPAQVWRPCALAGAHVPNDARGWRRQEGAFILSLAALGAGPVELVQV